MAHVQMKKDIIIQVTVSYLNRPSVEDSSEVIYGLGESGQLCCLRDITEKDESGKPTFDDLEEEQNG